MDFDISAWVGDTDKAAVAAIGIITCVCLTQIIKQCCNAPFLGPLHNPFFHLDTDRWMPVIAMVIGAIYGVLVASEPGWRDNLILGVRDGGWSVLCFVLVRKVFFPPAPDTK